MRFGKAEHIDFTQLLLPEDNFDANKIFKNKGEIKIPYIFIGCGHWGKNYLQNFYPKGTKDELAYYSTIFNSIEMNTTFYRNYKAAQYQKWYDKTEESFKFFPKIYQGISHYRRLNNIDEYLDNFLSSVVSLKDKLGTIFLQLREDFKVDKYELLANFIHKWPIDLPLAIELRNESWYYENDIFELCRVKNISIIITDAAGRRDLLHMRFTNAAPFIRFIGANHKSDFTRLEEWAERIVDWIIKGVSEIIFFVHQNKEEKSPELALFLKNQIQKNKRLNYQKYEI